MKFIRMPYISDIVQSLLENVGVIIEFVHSLVVLKQNVTIFLEVLMVYLTTEKLGNGTRYSWG